MSERVLREFRCPLCGEDRMDLLNWTDDDAEEAECQMCGTVYAPIPREDNPPPSEENQI
jgi:Zn ribbon nucleic-acid-binding protein